MLIRKIQYRITRFFQSIFKKTGNIEVNWGYWVFSLICFISIGLLGVNIFRIIKKGYERYGIIQEEKRRLEKLIEENAQLREDLKYYSSKEFIDIKAREELSLAFPNQRLVYIEREVVPERTKDKGDSENLEPSWHLWYDLIF